MISEWLYSFKYLIYNLFSHNLDLPNRMSDVYANDNLDWKIIFLSVLFLDVLMFLLMSKDYILIINIVSLVFSVVSPFIDEDSGFYF